MDVLVILANMIPSSYTQSTVQDPLKACTVTNRAAMRKALEVQREITDKASIYKNKLWVTTYIY